jgi:hypothetical protein
MFWTLPVVSDLFRPQTLDLSPFSGIRMETTPSLTHYGNNMSMNVHNVQAY